MVNADRAEAERLRRDVSFRDFEIARLRREVRDLKHRLFSPQDLASSVADCFQEGFVALPEQCSDLSKVSVIFVRNLRVLEYPPSNEAVLLFELYVETPSFKGEFPCGLVPHFFEDNSSD